MMTYPKFLVPYVERNERERKERVAEELFRNKGCSEWEELAWQSFLSRINDGQNVTIALQKYRKDCGAQIDEREWILENIDLGGVLEQDEYLESRRCK